MKVRLQAMTDEARELVRTGSYDEAIAICRHVLKQYPRHVESYRVLAEACLEKGDYEEATDLFKRVLSAAPHNFIAYVGLGIVYDEDGLTDEAIWQFERAFELAPANGEIRQMLKRLYGQRDGVEPQRLKLNRAALGHLYAKGGLYNEAVAEFREVLAQDPERIDIQLAIAEVFWRANKRREAAEVCQDILNKMPNCLKANLLLGEIWTDSGLEDEGETLLRRAKNMDPEGLVAHELLGERSPLPLEEVLVAPLESVEAELAEVSTAEALAEFAFPALDEPSAEVSFEEFESEAVVGGEVVEEVIGAVEALEQPVEEAVGEVAEMEMDLTELVPDELVPQELEVIEQRSEPELEVAAIEETVSTLEEEQPISAEVEDTLAAVMEEEISTAIEAEVMAPVSEPEAEKEGEDESPTIAALEAEFGALPELALSDEAEAERLALEASMPDESASSEEILAWLAKQRQPAEELDALAPMEEQVLAEEEELIGEEEASSEGGLLAELEEAIQQVTPPEAAALEAPEPIAVSETLPEIEMAEEPAAEKPEEEAESPVIAALEAEFGSLPGLDAEEISDEERSALESSMPPETATPEEIMAWLRERGTLSEMMPLPEMPEEGISEAIADRVGMEEIEPVQVAGVPSEAAEEGVSLQEAQSALRDGAVAGEAAEARAEIEIEAELEIAEMALGHDDLAIDFPEPIVEPLEASEVVQEEDEIAEAVAAEVIEVEEVLEEPAPEAIEAEVSEAQEALEATPEAIEAEVLEVEEVLEEPAPEAVEAEMVEIEEILEAAPGFIEAEAVQIEEILEEAPPEAVKAEIAEIEEALPEPEIVEAASPVADLLAAVEQSPGAPATRLALARAYVEDGSLDEATEQYETLARSAPDVLDDVIADLEAMTSEQPDLLALQQVLGDAYMEAGRLQDALDKYNWLLTKM